MSSVKKYLDLAKSAGKVDDQLAIEILLFAQKKFPESEQVLAELYLLYFVFKDFKGFEKAVRRYRKAAGANSNYHQKMGLIEFHRRDFDKALRNYEKAWALGGGASVLGEICILSCLLGRREECLEYCGRLIDATDQLKYLNFTAAFIAARLTGDETAKAALQQRVAPYKAKVASYIFRSFCTRMHDAMVDIDDKAALERAIRASGVAVNRPRTLLCPDDGEEPFTLPEGRWILKQTNGRGGKHTAILNAGTLVEPAADQILQSYVARPLLVFDRKFHVRVHVAIQDYAEGRAFLHRDGIVRLAPNPLSDDYEDMSRHITNTALHDVREPKVKRLNENLGSRVVWTLRELLAHLDGKGVHGLEQNIRAEIGAMVDVLRAENGMLERVAADFPGTLPVYLGFDLIVDEDLNVLVLELQVLPSLDGIWPMKEFIDPFFRDLFDLALGAEASPEAWSAV